MGGFNYETIRPFFNLIFLFISLFVLTFAMAAFLSYDSGIPYANLNGNSWLASIGRAFMVYLLLIFNTMMGSALTKMV